MLLKREVELCALGLNQARFKGDAFKPRRAEPAEEQYHRRLPTANDNNTADKLLFAHNPFLLDEGEGWSWMEPAGEVECLFAMMLTDGWVQRPMVTRGTVGGDRCDQANRSVWDRPADHFGSIGSWRYQIPCFLSRL